MQVEGEIEGARGKEKSGKKEAEVVVILSQESPKKKAKVEERKKENRGKDLGNGHEECDNEKEEEEEEEEEEVWRVVQIGQTAKKPTKKKAGEDFQYTETVRGKERQNLKETTDCAMCSAYYDALSKETGQTKSSLIKQCTRHRSRFQQVDTPPGYWDVGWK